MSPTDAWDQVRYSIETTIVSAGPSSEYSSFSRASSVDTTFTDNNSQQDQTGIGPHGSVSTLRQEPKYISSHKAGRAKQQAMATSTAIAEDDEEEEPDVGSQTDSKYAPQQAGITPTYDRSNFRSYGGTRDTLYEHSHKSSDSLAAYARQRRDQEENGTTIYPVSAAHKAEMDRALNGGSDVYDKTVSEFEKALDELNINSGALDVSSTFSRRPESSASSATKGSESEYSGGSRGMGMFVFNKQTLETVVERRGMMEDRGTSP